MHSGMTVQGVTTAATLWANAAMSLAIALGRVWVGLFLLAGIMIVQFVMRRLDVVITRARRTRVPSRVELIVQCTDEALPAVNFLWKKYAESQEAKVLRRERAPIDLTLLEEKLVPERGVIKVEARHAGFEDDG